MIINLNYLPGISQNLFILKTGLKGAKNIINKINTTSKTKSFQDFKTWKDFIQEYTNFVKLNFKIERPLSRDAIKVYFKLVIGLTLR